MVTNKKLKLYTAASLVSVAISFFLAGSAMATVTAPIPNSAMYDYASSLFNSNVTTDSGTESFGVLLTDKNATIPEIVKSVSDAYSTTNSGTGFVFYNYTPNTQPAPTYAVITGSAITGYIAPPAHTAPTIQLGNSDQSGFIFYLVPPAPPVSVTSISAPPTALNAPSIIPDPVLGDIQGLVAAGACAYGCTSSYDVFKQQALYGDVGGGTTYTNPNTGASVSNLSVNYNDYLPQITWIITPGPEPIPIVENTGYTTNSVPVDYKDLIYMPTPTPTPSSEPINSWIFDYNYNNNSDYIWVPGTPAGCGSGSTSAYSIKVDLNNPGSGKGKVVISASSTPYKFSGFSGDCTGTSSCNIENLSGTKEVVAGFSLPTVNSCGK